MDYNKIKNLLNTEGNEPLPSKLDWDNVESGIMEVIQSLDDGPSSLKEDKSDRKKIIIIFFLFMVCLLGLFCLSQRVKKLENLADIDKKRLVKGVNSNEARYTTSTPTSGGSKVKNDKVNIDDNVDITNAHVINSNEADFSQWSTQAKTLIKDNSKPTEAISSFSNSKMGKMQMMNQYSESVDRPVQKNSPYTSSQFSSLALESGQIGSEEIERQKIPTLPLINLRSFKLEPNNDLLVSIKAVNQLPQSKKIFTKSNDRLIWESGLFYWREGYGKIKPEREPYESTLPSFQLQISHVKGFKNSYFTQIGLHYQQLHSKFEYMTTLENYETINLVDTIIQVQNNLLSGEQSVIFGDVEVPVDAQHRIVHHNTIKLLKVSAAIGKTWQYNSLAADAYLGIGLTRRISSEGRTFFNDNIIDYNGTTNDFLNNKFIVNGFLGLRLQYYLSPRIGITSGIQLQKSLSSWSKEIDLDMRPTLIGFQFGIGYSL